MAHDSFEEDFDAANGSAFSGIVHRQYHNAMMEKKDAEIAALRAELATPVLVATNRLADALADERAKNAALRDAAKKAREALDAVDFVYGEDHPDGESVSFDAVRSALAALEEVLK